MDWRARASVFSISTPPTHISALVHRRTNPRCSLSIYILGRHWEQGEEGKQVCSGKDIFWQILNMFF